MTTIGLEAVRPVAETVTTSHRSTEKLHRPPTLTARQAPEWAAQAGHSLARRAIGYRMENVPFDEAVARLLDADEPTLQMARDYLAFTRFTGPLTAQVDALALVDAAIYRRADDVDRSRWDLASWWRRLRPRRRLRSRSDEA